MSYSLRCDKKLIPGWLSGRMPDLDTENPKVVRELHQWIASLVKAFEIDALRVDTVKHVRKDFWPDFVRAGGVAALGEVLHGGALDGSYLTTKLTNRSSVSSTVSETSDG